MALRQRFVTARHLRDQLRTLRGTNVSDQTVRNRLRDRSLRSRRSAVRSPLLERHRGACRDWCRQHVRWNRGQWADTILSDESRFTLQFNDGRARVFRRQRERFADVNVAQRLPFGGESVMVWAGISVHHRTALYVVNGNLNGLCIATRLFNLGGDRVVTDFLRQLNVRHTVWPTYSPDLSPGMS